MQLAFAFSKICMKIENCLHANKESCSYTLVAVFESVDSIAKISVFASDSIAAVYRRPKVYGCSRRFITFGYGYGCRRYMKSKAKCSTEGETRGRRPQI